MNATARKKVDIKCWAGESSNKDISCDGSRYWFTCGVSRVYYCESCARSLYTVPSFLYSFLWFIAQICMMEKFPIVWYTLVKKSHSHKSWNTLNYIRLCKWNVICNKTLLLANQIVWFLFMKKSIIFVSNILWRKNLKNDNILNCIDQNMCYYTKYMENGNCIYCSLPRMSNFSSGINTKYFDIHNNMNLAYEIVDLIIYYIN